MQTVRSITVAEASASYVNPLFRRKNVPWAIFMWFHCIWPQSRCLFQTVGMHIHDGGCPICCVPRSQACLSEDFVDFGCSLFSPIEMRAKIIHDALTGEAHQIDCCYFEPIDDLLWSSWPSYMNFQFYSYIPFIRNGSESICCSLSAPLFMTIVHRFLFIFTCDRVYF